MQVTEHVRAIRIPFTLEVAQGRLLERFVYAYVVCEESVYLIDCGVASTEDALLDEVRMGPGTPPRVGIAIITHPHPDHIGGALGIRSSSGCQFAAHADGVSWIEDVERQARERPVPGFHSIVGGSVPVDVVLEDGDTIPLDGGGTLSVIQTPGHSRGQIALLYDRDKALFAGDAVPLPGGIPIYEDVPASVASVRRLMALKGLEVLLSSWDEPRHGDEVYATLARGLSYLQSVHELVREEKRAHPSDDLRSLTARVLANLGLPDLALSPLTMKSVEAHLRLVDHPDVLGT